MRANLNRRVRVACASISLVLFTILPGEAFAADAPQKSLGPDPIDGITVEAVESYVNPKRQQLDFGLSILPLNPYFDGFGINLGYTYYYGKTYAWQIIDVDYLYSVDTGLTSQLAQNYSVNPQSIERVNFMVSSDINYVIAYGKFVFAKEYIRYFRSALMGGPTFASSNKEGSVGLNVGWRLEVFVNDDFSWSAQIRDIWMPSNIGNNLAFILGTSYGF